MEIIISKDEAAKMLKTVLEKSMPDKEITCNTKYSEFSFDVKDKPVESGGDPVEGNRETLTDPKEG